MITIVGGGLIGLASAIGMSQLGHEVRVLDKKSFDPTTDDHQRLYALNHASKQLLDTLGVWPLIPIKHQVAYQKMHIWDEKTQAQIDLNSQLISKSELGWMIPAQALYQALLNRCKALPITLCASTEIIHLESYPQGIELHTSKGTYNCSFLLITDGAQSKLRTLLSIPITQWPYHQSALTATVHTTLPHQYTAYQCFTHRGPLAFLPLADPNQCSIVWSADAAFIQSKMTQPENGFSRELSETFQYILGDSTLLSKRQTFPLTMRHTQQYHGSRWILLGDAAHTLHPLAGLGLNLGFADLRTWLTLIKTKPWSSPAVLGAYHRARTTEGWMYIALIQLLKTTFLSPLPVVQCLKKIGMNHINHSHLLKKSIIQVAQGTTALL